MAYIDSAAADPSWVVPDEEPHKHFNDVEREVDTLVYGRRMYEIMAGYWPTADQDPSASGAVVEYAQIWKPVRKVVFSSTLELKPVEIHTFSSGTVLLRCAAVTP